MKIGKSVYYCVKKATPNGIEEFENPVEIKVVPGQFTVQPATGYAAIQEFGTNIKKYQTAICQPYERWENVFKVGDVFYLDGATPSANEEYNGDLANYIVDDVSYQNLAIKLTLKRI